MITLITLWWATVAYLALASVTLGVLNMVWDDDRKGTSEMFFWSALWPILWLIVAGGMIGAYITKKAPPS